MQKDSAQWTFCNVYGQTFMVYSPGSTVSMCALWKQSTYMDADDKAPVGGDNVAEFSLLEVMTA